MDVSGVFVELFGRVPPLVSAAVDGLSPTQLQQQPAEGANPIGWLVWHLARVQDHHGAELVDEPQLWVAGGWAAQFGLEPDPHDTGYGHDPADVQRVAPASAEACIRYQSAVHDRLDGFAQRLSAAELDRVVDEGYDPPVTLGVRLVSIADDALQHAGQAAYLRGVLDL